MNRIQLLSAILGILMLITGTLFIKGYFKTWEDYRPLIVKEMGSECITDLVITIANDLQCKPWLDPKNNLEKCTHNNNGIKVQFLSGAMLCAIEDSLNPSYKKEEQ